MDGPLYYLWVWTENTDMSSIDHRLDRLQAGTIQVAFVFAVLHKSLTLNVILHI